MPDAIKKILIPSDGSEPAAKAIQFGGVLAQATGATVEMVYVREPYFFAISSTDIGLIPLAEGPGVSQSDIDKAVEENVIKPAFEKAKAILKPYTERVQVTVLEGQPARMICRHAEEHGADLIVIGSRGHSAFAELTLGSVSSQVMHHAPCPVTVVR